VRDLLHPGDKVVNPDEVAFAFDFWDIWQFGRAALDGLNPWAVHESFYPPATIYFLFAFFALFPMSVSFIVLTVASAASLVAVSGRKAFALLLFFPVAAIFAQGQIDILFLPLIMLLARGGRKTIITAAILITLKPQIALVILPWYVVRWLMEDRRQLIYFVIGAATLHIAPILFRPTALLDWLAVFGSAGGNKASMAAGIWQLYEIFPIGLLGAASTIAAVIAMKQDEKTSRAIMAVFSPLLSYYDAVILWNCAPTPLIVASGLIGIGLAHLTGSFLPLTIVAWTVLAYRVATNTSSFAIRHGTIAKLQEAK
jgi:hypothetical protein